VLPKTNVELGALLSSDTDKLPKPENVELVVPSELALNIEVAEDEEAFDLVIGCGRVRIGRVMGRGGFTS